MSAHWLIRYDPDDGEPFGEVCACGERIHEGDGIRYSAESWSNFIHDDCDATGEGE